LELTVKRGKRSKGLKEVMKEEEKKVINDSLHAMAKL
jgi:hypothetical protein